MRINVLGVGISVLTLDSAVDAVLAAIESGSQGYVTVTGVHGVSECQSDLELRRIHNESLLSTPDGVPLTWMGRLQGVGADQMRRVYGPDLMLQLLDRGQDWGQDWGQDPRLTLTLGRLDNLNGATFVQTGMMPW